MSQVESGGKNYLRKKRRMSRLYLITRQASMPRVILDDGKMKIYLIWCFSSKDERSTMSHVNHYACFLWNVCHLRDVETVWWCLFSTSRVSLTFPMWNAFVILRIPWLCSERVL
ncbi:hypothetical protein ISCGN_023613 [Ixodes scapularis]